MGDYRGGHRRVEQPQKDGELEPVVPPTAVSREKGGSGVSGRIWSGWSRRSCNQLQTRVGSDRQNYIGHPGGPPMDKDKGDQSLI